MKKVKLEQKKEEHEREIILRSIQISINRTPSNQHASSNKEPVPRLTDRMMDYITKSKTIVWTRFRCLMSLINGLQWTKVEITKLTIIRSIQPLKIKRLIQKSYVLFIMSSPNLSRKIKKNSKGKMDTLENAWILWIF